MRCAHGEALPRAGLINYWTESDEGNTLSAKHECTSEARAKLQNAEVALEEAATFHGRYMAGHGPDAAYSRDHFMRMAELHVTVANGYTALAAVEHD